MSSSRLFSRILSDRLDFSFLVFVSSLWMNPGWTKGFLGQNKYFEAQYRTKTFLSHASRGDWCITKDHVNRPDVLMPYGIEYAMTVGCVEFFLGMEDKRMLGFVLAGNESSQKKRMLECRRLAFRDPSRADPAKRNYILRHVHHARGSFQLTNHMSLIPQLGILTIDPWK